MKRKKEVKSKPLAIVGMYPPPYGGVGIHLKRLVSYLDNTDLDYVLYNTSPARAVHPKIVNVGWSLRWYFKLLLFCRHKVIHCHTGRWWPRIMLAFIGLLHPVKIMYTAHSYAFCEEFLNGNKLRKWTVQTVLKRAATIIAVNRTIKAELLKIGIQEEKVPLIPAFIPPPSEEGTDEVPIKVREFCKDMHPILAANGAFVRRDGQDVYGLETMTTMMDSLVQVYPKAALIVYVVTRPGSDKSRFGELISRVETSALKSHILFYDSNQEFYPVLKLADVFLRPTLADGDALSIREALQMGVPIVASDVVKRPEYTNLFRGKDQNALNAMVIKVLNKLPEQKKIIAQASFQNTADKLIKVYEKLLGS